MMFCATMLLTISHFDGIPIGASEPMTVELLHQITATDGGEYWLGKLNEAIIYPKAEKEITVRYVIASPGWVGTSFRYEFSELRVNIAYVTDETVLGDSILDFTKVNYIAIGSGTVSQLEKDSFANSQSCPSLDNR